MHRLPARSALGTLGSSNARLRLNRPVAQIACYTVKSLFATPSPGRRSVARSTPVVQVPVSAPVQALLEALEQFSTWVAEIPPV